VRAVVVTGQSGAHALRVEEVPAPVPGPGELLVEVVAAGVNRADLLQAAGQYPPPPGAPPWPGLEVSGRVVALGPGVGSAPDDEPWRVGDAVAGLLPGGGYAEWVTLPVGLALRVPAALHLPDAAALPEALATVWSTLRAAHLAPHETLLVRGGSGGIGTVAVQLARALGVRVLATAGGEARCRRVGGLGADVVVDHREPGLVPAVLEATGGAGVDVVLDVLGAGGLAENLAVLATGGRLAVIGLQRGRHGDLDLGLLLERRATVLGTTLRSRPLAEKVQIMADVRAVAWPLVAEGRVRPVVHTRLPLERAAEAHRLLATGEAFGKVLLEP
jgi:putative PIG3 family NAD(P)H quinone oxidoreductase